MSKKKKKDKHKENDYNQYDNMQYGYNPHMHPYNYNQGYHPNMQPNMQPQPNMQQGNMYGQNFNQNPQTPQGQADLSTLMGLLNNIDSNQLMNMLSQINSNQNENGNYNVDQAFNLINSLKPFMPPERISMIEGVLKNFNSNNKK